jgi:probable phosphoglycerate mutase
VARHCGSLPVQAEASLDEIDVGAWTGRRFDALAVDPAWQRWNLARAGARAPGGESMGAVQQRALEWSLSLPDRHAGEAVAAVSHADVIKAVIAGVLGLSLDRHDSLSIDPASISAVAVWRGGARVLLVNETAATAT